MAGGRSLLSITRLQLLPFFVTEILYFENDYLMMKA